MHSSHQGILDGRCGSPDRAMGLPVKGLGGIFRSLRHFLWPKGGSDSTRHLRPTAYLDGLRGFAAFLVYIHHHELWAHASSPYNDNAFFESSFGWSGKFRFAAFYGIRNLFAGGHMAVACFYVISGYVLSVKPLSLINAGEHLRVADNLASAFFRRWFRLYLPLLVTTLVYVTSWHVFGYWNSASEPKSTLGEELWNWYVEFKNFSFLFKEGWMWLSCNTHLWSIPLEMRGSIIIYTACLALMRATVKARLLCQVALIFYFIYIVDGWYGAYFVAGMLQADLDLLAKKSAVDGSYFPGFLRRLEPYRTFIYGHLLVVAVYLAGVPSHTDKVKDLRANPGWYWLSFLKPQAMYDPKWFYLFFAANIIVAAIPRMHWMRSFFESRFCQFLGRISFSLYLVHGPLLATLGDRIYHAVGWVRMIGKNPEMMAAWSNKLPLSKAGPMGLEPAMLLPQIILLPLTLWLADVVTRTVDEPSVRFAQWMYKTALGGAVVETKPIETVPLMRLT